MISLKCSENFKNGKIYYRFWTRKRPLTITCKLLKKRMSFVTFFTEISHGHHGLSNHWWFDCLFNRLFWLMTMKALQALYYWPFVKGIHQWPMDSHHEGPMISEVSPCHDINIQSSAIIMPSNITWCCTHLCCDRVRIWWGFKPTKETFVLILEGNWLRYHGTALYLGKMTGRRVHIMTCL